MQTRSAALGNFKVNGEVTLLANDLAASGCGAEIDGLLNKYCIYLKVYGERNAGTRYIEHVIRANFAVSGLQSNNHIYEFARTLAGQLPKGTEGKVRSQIIDIDCNRTLQSDFGWKHGVPPRDQIVSAAHQYHTLFVCVAKHPVSWLRSLAKRPYNPVEKVPKTLSDLIQYDWPLTSRDNLSGLTRINPIDMWNIKNAAFVDLRSIVRKFIVTAYEDVLRNPAAFIKQIADHLLVKTDEPIWALPSTKGDGITFDEYREKYTSGNIFEGVSGEDKRFIKSRIDGMLMDTFGYKWE